MGSNQRLRSRAPELLGLLDVGTSKTVCLIVAATRGGRPENVQVLGAGCQPTRGLKAGVVIELDAAEQSVRAAVAEAERAAGAEVRQVLLSIACGRLKSATFAAETEVEGRTVGDADIARLLAAGRSYAEREGRALLHMNCIGYRLDGAAGIAEPYGLAGRALSADFHAVTSDDAPLRNLIHVAERAYLSVSGLVPAPYASALAATTAEERQDGVAAVDFGAGTTTLAIFAEGHLVANEVIPVGGNHFAFDLARTLQVSVAEAERIKLLCGTLDAPAADDRDAIPFAPGRENVAAPHEVPKGKVRDVMRGRVTGLLGQLAERIERSGFAGYARRMVVTGGTSQLSGLTELASQTFARPVRAAGPRPTRGVPVEMCGPAFSVALGLIAAASDPAAGVRRASHEPAARGYLRRVGRWLQTSF